MLCYRDMTFCSDEFCANEECHRNISTVDHEHVKEIGLPLALSDFSESCEKRIDLFEVFGVNPPQPSQEKINNE